MYFSLWENALLRENILPCDILISPYKLMVVPLHFTYNRWSYQAMMPHGPSVAGCLVNHATLPTPGTFVADNIWRLGKRSRESKLWSI